MRKYARTFYYCYGRAARGALPARFWWRRFWEDMTGEEDEASLLKTRLAHMARRHENVKIKRRVNEAMKANSSCSA